MIPKGQGMNCIKIKNIEIFTNFHFIISDNYEYQDYQDDFNFYTGVTRVKDEDEETDESHFYTGE